MSRAVIIGGVRTPFVRAGDALNRVPAADLGLRAVREVMDRHDLSASEVDEVIAGNVCSPPEAANIARVMALRAGIPRDRIAHTVHRNCASGLEAVTQACDRIDAGRADCIVAVGVDSMSHVGLFWQKAAADKLVSLSRAKGWGQRLKRILAFRPRDLAPVPALKLGLTDPVVDMIMGLTAEKLAREYDISREQQDEFALQSHRKAVAAWAEHRLFPEVLPFFPPPECQPITTDVGPRAEQSLQALGKLRPFFDRRWGTVTVGNACGVTDGAAALLVMSAEKAQALGYQPAARLRGYAYAGCDPERMGLGPVYSTARVLHETGLRLADMELVEINEAFAAQVLACLAAFETPPADCQHAQAAGLPHAVDPERLNVNGGAIAIGHPVGATGTRLLLTLMTELKRRDEQVGLATLCVGGGQGGAVVLERIAA